jgi:hypothetical protein
LSLSFYALNKAGILLYSQQVLIKDSLTNQPNPHLMAGFFSAIENFSKEVVNSNVDIIEMGEYKVRFSFEDANDCIFCLIYNKVTEDNKFHHLINVLKALFLHSFKKQIEKKSANVTIFKKFDPILELILEAFGIKNESLQIEHFLCGFFGELRDFQSDKDLICPKCKKKLAEDGIDYRIKID